MATDFRDGRSFPRRGRTQLGNVLWLARVSDKGRAAAAGTIHDYIYPCPMDKGVFERWGITPQQFDDALCACPDDATLLAWLSARVTPTQLEAANAWLLTEKIASLDRQDAEEGATADV